MNSEDEDRFFAKFFGSGDNPDFEKSYKDGDTEYVYKQCTHIFNVSGDGSCSCSCSSSSLSEGKAAAIESKLSCSLEELYSGFTKKLKITRNVVPPNHGLSAQESEIIKVDVKRGWKKGTRITFANKGNQEPNKLPADLVFVIDEKPHAVYKRDGDDLIMNHNLSLADALAGTNVNLKTLDGRNLLIPLTDIVTPGYELVVAGEGMPISKNGNGSKGNLKIKFDVQFPKRLTMEQKIAVRHDLEG